MKCITVHQPWATLLAVGATRFHARTWQTSHRGPVAIQAAAAFRPAQRMLCYAEPLRSLLAAAGHVDWRQLPTGLVIALAEIVDCKRVEEIACPGPADA